MDVEKEPRRGLCAILCTIVFIVIFWDPQSMVIALGFAGFQFVIVAMIIIIFEYRRFQNEEN